MLGDPLQRTYMYIGKSTSTQLKLTNCSHVQYTYQCSSTQTLKAKADKKM